MIEIGAGITIAAGVSLGSVPAFETVYYLITEDDLQLITENDFNLIQE